jgi:hypothetical protein
VGKLLGDPAVWDDTPAPARPLPRVASDQQTLLSIGASGGRLLVVELCDRVVRLVDGRQVQADPGQVGGPVA